MSSWAIRRCGPRSAAGLTRTAVEWSGRPSATSTGTCSQPSPARSARSCRPRGWPSSVPDLAPLHPVSRLHLEELTDSVGIMQHAIGSRPDPAHGYCVDDVARAIQVDLLHANVLGWPAVAPTAWQGMRFLDDAFD